MQGTRQWWIALLGLAIFAFSIAALSGPGRIDIVDGQTRYEVARSLVEHGDVEIRDPDVVFAVFPGRGGRAYASYRLPQSLLGVPAILAADLLGPPSEARRHFFFVLTSAAAAAALVLAFALWFRALGRAPRAAAGWALAGLGATPLWFYATSTFDEALGSLFAVSAVVVAFRGRRRPSLAPHLAAGACLALAFHVKPPLAVFLLPVLAAGHDPGRPARRQSARRLAVLAVLLAGIGLHLVYERYKFPPESRAARDAAEANYVQPAPGNPLPGAASLAVSPGKGALWYCPAMVVAAAGLWSWRRRRPWLAASIVASAGVFYLFVASLQIFAGDPAWGPRYLTPLFALGWLAVPDGAAAMGRRRAVALLALSVVVQIGSLAVDPHRLYVERGLDSGFYVERPWAYFDPGLAHLVQRPREVAAVAAAMRGDPPAAAFTPAPSPTFAFPVLDFTDRGPEAVRRYHVLRSFRPWWISHRFLGRGERPVPLGASLAALLALAAIGLWGAVRWTRRRPGA